MENKKRKQLNQVRLNLKPQSRKLTIKMKKHP